MFRFLAILLLFYLFWKIVPAILRVGIRRNLKKQPPPPSLNIDKSEIEDAEFKEIEPPRN